VDEELLVNETLVQSLEDRFSSKPSKILWRMALVKTRERRSVYCLFYFLHFITCLGSALKNISYTELREAFQKKNGKEFVFLPRAGAPKFGPISFFFLGKNGKSCRGLVF
jgi:hypothetical protein